MQVARLDGHAAVWAAALAQVESGERRARSRSICQQQITPQPHLHTFSDKLTPHSALRMSFALGCAGRDIRQLHALKIGVSAGSSLHSGLCCQGLTPCWQWLMSMCGRCCTGATAGCCAAACGAVCFASGGADVLAAHHAQEHMSSQAVAASTATAIATAKP